GQELTEPGEPPDLLCAGLFRSAVVEVGGTTAAAPLQFRAGPGGWLLGAGTAPGLARTKCLVARDARARECRGHHSAREPVGATAAARGATGSVALRLTGGKAAMRPTQLASFGLSFVLLGLLVSGSWAQSGRQRAPFRPQKQAAQAPQVKRQPILTWRVEGYG